MLNPTLEWWLSPLHNLLLRYMGGAGLILYKKGSAPPPPDYTAAANAQAGASKEITNMQTWANRPDQTTPWGKTTWDTSSQVDPATGQQVTKWTQNESLNPQLQTALDQQLQLQADRTNLASGFMGRVEDAYSKPFAWDQMASKGQNVDARYTDPTGQQRSVPQYQFDTSAPSQTTQTTNAPAMGDQRQRIEQMAFDRLQPQHDRALQQLHTQLANQGVTPGSEAYNMEMQRLSDQQSRERYDAMQYASGEQQRMNEQVLAQQQQAFGQDVTGQQAQNTAIGQQFGEGLQAGQFANQASQNLFAQNQAANAQNFQQDMARSEYQNKLRQQDIAEEQLRRQMPLNEMNAVLQGQQVQGPSMPSFVTAQASETPQLLNAAKMGYDAQMDSFNAKQGQDQALMSGLFGLGTSAMKAGMFSDERLKEDATSIGGGWYLYKRNGKWETGVMAQELLLSRPELVHVGPGGYLMVDYGGI